MKKRLYVLMAICCLTLLSFTACTSEDDMGTDDSVTNGAEQTTPTTMPSTTTPTTMPDNGTDIDTDTGLDTDTGMDTDTGIDTDTDTLIPGNGTTTTP